MGRSRGYIKKPVIVQAEQWFKNGDHLKDDSTIIFHKDSKDFLSEGKIVKYYRTSKIDGGGECKQCGKFMGRHGWIDTLEGGHIVCPSDWIITGIEGEHYPIKNSVFKRTYQLLEEE